MSLGLMFPKRKLNKQLRNEIREYYDFHLNVTYDDLINRYGLTRAQLKKILLSNWEI
jgi:hypothetical protein